MRRIEKLDAIQKEYADYSGTSTLKAASNRCPKDYGISDDHITDKDHCCADCLKCWMEESE